MSAEFRGRWVLRGGIRVPVPDEPKPAGRPRQVRADPVGELVGEVVWTDESLKAAHAAFVRGKRDVLTVAGHREWYRRYKRRRRAGVLSAADRAWCERDAVLWSWSVDEHHNRASITNTTT